MTSKVKLDKIVCTVTGDRRSGVKMTAVTEPETIEIEGGFDGRGTNLYYVGSGFNRTNQVTVKVGGKLIATATLKNATRKGGEWVIAWGSGAKNAEDAPTKKTRSGTLASKGTIAGARVEPRNDVCQLVSAIIRTHAGLSFESGGGGGSGAGVGSVKVSTFESLVARLHAKGDTPAEIAELTGRDVKVISKVLNL